MKCCKCFIQLFLKIVIRMQVYGKVNGLHDSHVVSTVFEYPQYNIIIARYLDSTGCIVNNVNKNQQLTFVCRYGGNKQHR